MEARRDVTRDRDAIVARLPETPHIRPMRKRTTRILIGGFAILVAAAAVILSTELSNIFKYEFYEDMCSRREIDAPEPRQEPIYIACSGLPVEPPTLN